MKERRSDQKVSVATGMGSSGHVALYEVPDTELAVGSTLGGPKVTATIKASGAIEKVFGVDCGAVLIGTVLLRHYDAVTGMYLSQDRPGRFYIYPERQEHRYALTNGIQMHETVFVLSTQSSWEDSVDPPAVYQWIELTNPTDRTVELMIYAHADLRGDTAHDVEVRFDRRLGALVAWNRSSPEQARVFGCSQHVESFETTLDYAKAIAETCPGPLSNKTKAPLDPLGSLQTRCRVEPQQTVRFHYLAALGNGRHGAIGAYRACPDAETALRRTTEYYGEMTDRAVVVCPDPNVNRGVLWSKANMLRVQTQAPTGWCFTNDPTRSNNSVGRDTAWFAFGADYLNPAFARESLLAYVRLQERNGKIIEYYDIRNGKTEDYGLNINDNTPLLIMALWHHYNATGDEGFLKEVYPAAAKAARYILSQRNEQGLVWCTATGTSDWGIVGWRNVIPNYRLSGATTEVNSECYAALKTISHMARVLDKHEDSETFDCEAETLKDAINRHLYNSNNGLYLLNIDLDGNPRSDVTSDLVFPVMFDVAPDDVAAEIIGRLSNEAFWTQAGIRTTPRDAPNYTPNNGWGLLGGVWVGVSFWYAFAAAKYSPSFMAHALSVSFENYSSDPRRNNTVPGQFSEWLHGETLVNEGMMLSPWFPPRYLWAAVEGVAGFSSFQGSPTVDPRLAPEWKWLAVQNLPYRDQRLTYFAARMPDVHVYTNFVSSANPGPYITYEEDISSRMEAIGDSLCRVGLRHGQNLLLFVGNTAERTTTTSLRVRDHLAGSYRCRTYNSLFGRWMEHDQRISADEIGRGMSVKLERKGFCVLDLQQEV
ncbi:MAG TPA: hypothetical protein VF898_07530 [Chloroflexota bacterium]